MEKRFFRRVNITDGMCTSAHDDVFTGIIENISLGGLFVRTNKQVEVGDKIQLNINLSSDSKNITLVAHVIAMRIGDEWVAFKFDNLATHDFWTLQSFIHNVKG